MYLIFWPLEWNFRDLTILAVSLFSILAFSFEAYVQYGSLKAGVQKV